MAVCRRSCIAKMEIEPRYERVEIRPDGTVELTVVKGKKVVKRLRGD